MKLCEKCEEWQELTKMDFGVNRPYRIPFENFQLSFQQIGTTTTALRLDCSNCEMYFMHSFGWINTEGCFNDCILILEEE